MRRVVLIAVCCLISIETAVSAAAQSEVSRKASDLHFRSFVIDTHDDTTQRLIYEHFDIEALHRDGAVDVPRMRRGGLNGIFFSIYVPGTITGPEAVKQALDQIDAVRGMVAANPKDLVLCTTASEVRKTRRAGKIAVLMGVEGGHMIDSDLAVLRTYAALGVRYMTLAHMLNDEWADSSTDKPVHNGLTDFGKEVVREMNRLGVAVDVSHVSDKTFYDALTVSKAPIIASHSSCRAICDAPRNMSDEMIKALAAAGGVIQINYNLGYISQEYREATNLNPVLIKAQNVEIEERCGKDESCQMNESERLTRQLVAEGKLPRVSWQKIIEHIDHVVKLVGASHVGLGSDFDGANMPFGMEDTSQLPRITDALLKKGYSEPDVQKILGGNILRVMEQIENTARTMPTISRNSGVGSRP